MTMHPAVLLSGSVPYADDDFLAQNREGFAHGAKPGPVVRVEDAARLVLGLAEPAREFRFGDAGGPHFVDDGDLERGFRVDGYEDQAGVLRLGFGYGAAIVDAAAQCCGQGVDGAGARIGIVVALGRDA